MHCFAVNLWRLLSKRPVCRAKDSRTCFALLHPLPTDDLVQVKEGSFLIPLHGRCLTPHPSVVGGLLSVLGKICGHFSFRELSVHLLWRSKKLET